MESKILWSLEGTKSSNQRYLTSKKWIVFGVFNFSFLIPSLLVPFSRTLASITTIHGQMSLTGSKIVFDFFDSRKSTSSLFTANVKVKSSPRFVSWSCIAIVYLSHRKINILSLFPLIVFFRSSKIPLRNPVFCVSRSATKAEYNTAD